MATGLSKTGRVVRVVSEVFNIQVIHKPPSLVGAPSSAVARGALR